MFRIGRNDSCPCGSGTKYKKCCIDKKTIMPVVPNWDGNTLFENYKSSLDSEEDISDLLKYDRLDMLAVIAYLQVLPENHGKYVRLESVQRLLLSAEKQRVGEKINYNNLIEFFEANFLYNSHEDPPENLFTENIMTPIGNMIIFSGLAQGQLYFLQQLINVVSMGEFEKTFVHSCLSPTLLLLSISNYIAEGLGYSRNMRGVHIESNNIYIPTTNLDQKRLFRISKYNMEKLANSFGGDISNIDLFLLDPLKEKWVNIHYDENPIIHKPIIYDSVSKEYIVISPTTLVYAAINCLYKKLIEYNKLNDVLGMYSYSCWQHSDFILRSMGYHSFGYEFEKTSLPIYEELYLFDRDKLAHVVFIYDNGVDFNVNKPLEFIDNESLHEKIISHIEKVQIRLKSDNHISDKYLFAINIYLGIGRSQIIELPNTLCLDYISMSIYELEILSKSGKCNNLTFWNYSGAVKDISRITPFFLDNIAYFITNDESFYISDSYAFGYIFISVGYSFDFRVEAVQKNDIHLCETTDGTLIPVIREDLPATLPIYTNRDLLGVFIASTPSLGSNVIIQPLKTFIEPSNDKEKFESDICIAISYWISVLSEPIKQNLLPLRAPIKIKVNVVDITDDYTETFESIDNDVDLFDQIKIIDTEKYSIIEFDKYFLYHLIPDNNDAEIIMMRKVLCIIYDVYWREHGYDYDVIMTILKEYMPSSIQKKIIFKVTDYDIRLFQGNVVKFKSSSPYALNRELDNLGKILTATPYEPIDNLELDSKKTLLNKVVLHFYEKLRALLKDYNGFDIIERLLSLYDAAIQKRVAFDIELIPLIECYKEYTDIHSYVSNQSKKTQKYL